MIFKFTIFKILRNCKILELKKCVLITILFVISFLSCLFLNQIMFKKSYGQHNTILKWLFLPQFLLNKFLGIYRFEVLNLQNFSLYAWFCLFYHILFEKKY